MAVFTRKSKSGLLRLFALSWATLFGLLACWVRVLLPDPPIWPIPLAMAFMFAGGVVVPSAMRGPYRLTERALAPVGRLFSVMTLAVVYFGIFTPFAFALRLLRWDPLQLGRWRRAASAWVERSMAAQPGNYPWQY